MESTGTYWVPVWRQLEGHIDKRLLCNPQQVKALAGRKSDRRDGQRIAEFLQDGRLDPSFVPPKEIQQSRELLRRRVSLVQEHNHSMVTARYVYCHDGGQWLGYFDEFPEYMTQGDSVEDLQTHFSQPVPRHREINENLAWHILKKLRN